jgi:DNA-directed RNA polymerase specialized sigma24 family protein
MNQITKNITDLEIDSLEFELEEQPEQVFQPRKTEYVNNKELQAEFVKYYELKKQWIADGKPGNPPLTHKIGQAILDIATRRTYSRQFIGYTSNWKEEMIGDAIECCVKYAHNYNPEKYNNPFAYITQLVTNALIQRIKREKKEIYTKYKSFDNMGGFQAFSDENVEDLGVENFNEASEMYQGYLEYIAEYEEKQDVKKQVDKSTDGLLEFLSDSD